MDAVNIMLDAAFKYIQTLKITDLIDIVIIAFLMYKLMILSHGLVSLKVARVVVAFSAILLVSTFLNLTVLNFLLNRVAEMAFIMIIILFQPELRRLLERLERGRFPKIFGSKEAVLGSLDSVISQTVSACIGFSNKRTGALIVFERKTPLNDQIKSGTTIDAVITSELLRNIFFPKSPMHDGAVVVREGRLAGAGCILPLSANMNLSRDLGMRHRAGIGMSERSDAVTVIVSEETGDISVAVGGMLKRALTPETLDKLLKTELAEDGGLSAVKK